MIKHIKRNEELIYFIIWLSAFLFPLVVGRLQQAVHPADLVSGTLQQGILWHEIIHLWKLVGVFCVCFVVHNHFIAPHLVYRNRRALYFSLAVGLLLLFTVVHCYVARHDTPFFRRGPHGPAATEYTYVHAPNDSYNAPGGKLFRHSHRPRPRSHGLFPMPIDFVIPRELSAVLTMALLFGANVAVKFSFKSVDERLRISQLERRNLEQQVQYLKYQINPHFFMNTLNNIHALVDINPEQAKTTIVLLSRMMRYVLYDGERRLMPLRREAESIHHYIRLMRIRYPKNVDIRYNSVSELSEALVPPLLFITFVENAFKHGISAAVPSFVHVDLISAAPENSSEDAHGFSEVSASEASHVCLVVTNSIPPQQPQSVQHTQQPKEGGVGLKNALERLCLIYGTDFSYRVDRTPSSYKVTLALPLHP